MHPEWDTSPSQRQERLEIELLIADDKHNIHPFKAVSVARTVAHCKTCVDTGSSLDILIMANCFSGCNIIYIAKALKY